MEQNILKKAELKTTKKRQMLLFLLQKHARPMTAEELHEIANNILPMNVSTVYRTLNTLTEKDIQDNYSVRICLESKSIRDAINGLTDDQLNDLTEKLKGILEQMDDSDEEILVLTVGDGLSGGYQSALGARNLVSSPERIHVMDSRTLAGPLRYLAKKAVMLKEQGLSDTSNASSSF